MVTSQSLHAINCEVFTPIAQRTRKQIADYIKKGFIVSSSQMAFLSEILSLKSSYL